MTDFIRDNTSLGAAKSDYHTFPLIPTDQKVVGADWNLLRSALLDVQTYLRGGVLDVTSQVVLVSGKLRANTLATVGPELHYEGYRGYWGDGIDVANTPTSRDFVERFIRLDYSIADGATTSGSPTLTSASDGGFTTQLIGGTVTGTGIPNNTTILAVAGPTSLTMSNNATATATGLRVTITTGLVSDVAYWKHRGALSPTFGVGVTPPDGSARLQVAAADLEPAMGTARFRVGASQTGKALTVHDSTPVDQFWIDSGFYLSGSSGNGVKVAAESSASGRAITLADNTKATQYSFDLPTGSGGVLRLRYITGALPIVDFGTDGSTKFLGTKIGFFNGTPAVKPTVSGAKGGNAALDSLMTALSGLGLVTDSTTA